LFAGKACSYSARFARDLEATYQGGGGGGGGGGGRGGPVGVTYRNLAMGGTTTAGALPQLPLLLAGGDGPAGRATGRQAGPDLVLVDFSVNDRFEEQDWVEAAVSRAGSSSDSSTGGGGGDGAAGFDAGAKVFAATEALLRHVLAAHPNTAIVRARDHTDPHASCFYFFYYICLRSPSFPRLVEHIFSPLPLPPPTRGARRWWWRGSASATRSPGEPTNAPASSTAYRSWRTGHF